MGNTDVAALEIIQRSDVFYAAMEQNPAPTLNASLNDVLNNIVLATEHGIPAADATQYALYTKADSVALEVVAPDVATATKVQTWLGEQKVFVTTNQLTANLGGPRFAVLLPVDQIALLLEAFSTVTLTADGAAGQGLTMNRAHWPKDTLTFVQAVVDGFKIPEPTFLSSTRPPTPSAAQQKLIDGHNDKIKAYHNVKRWHDAGYEGDGVTVGIIDWAYKNFDDVPHLDDLSKTTSRANTSATYNAFCQSVFRGTVIPSPNVMFGNSKTFNCEPFAGIQVPQREIGPPAVIGKPIDHGVNVAELVNTMAPEADLLMAQANSPMQVYDAARWLKARGVDVIVHASG